MRPHHYLFSHQALPDELEAADGMLGILANPANQDYLVGLWDSVPNLPEFHRLTVEAKQTKGGYLNSPRVGEIIPAWGLGYTSHWLGGQHLAFLIRLPRPLAQAESHFVAITTSPTVQYFSLEKATASREEDTTTFNTWAAGKLIDLGPGPTPDPQLFLKRICQHAGLPETVEEPTEAQIQSSLDVELDGDVQDDSLSAEDGALLNQWHNEAEMALIQQDFQQAESLFRNIYYLRIAKQGPRNPNATLALSPLTLVLSLSGKTQEAEGLCQQWWSWCRRYRPLGHSETLVATSQLAECYRLQGRIAEAGALLRYRLQLAQLAHGKNTLVATQTAADVQAQTARGEQEKVPSSATASVIPGSAPEVAAPEAFALGTVLSAKGRFQEAVKWFEEAQRLGHAHAQGSIAICQRAIAATVHFTPPELRSSGASISPDASSIVQPDSITKFQVVQATVPTPVTSFHAFAPTAPVTPPSPAPSAPAPMPLNAPSSVAQPVAPKEPDWMLEGLRLAEERCWPEALEAYEKASSMRSGDPRLWYKKGVALTMLRRFEESLVCYDRAIQLDPAYTDAWFNKGSSLSLGFGRHQEAIQCFETAKRLGEPAADTAIAICYQKLSPRSPRSGASRA